MLKENFEIFLIFLTPLGVKKLKLFALGKPHGRNMNNSEEISSSGVAKPPPNVKLLFRQQAVEFTTTRQYGEIILSGYLSHRLVTIIFCGFAIAIISFFVFFTTTRKAETSGVLLPSEGLIRVRSGQAGIVTQVHIKEGQKVKIGDVLFVLSNERNIGAIQSAERTVSMLLQNRRDSYQEELSQASQQSTQRMLAAQKRAVALLEEGARLDSQIALQKSRVSLIKQGFHRFEELKITNYISAAQLEEKEGEVLDQRQRLAELERLKGINARDYDSAKSEYNDLLFQAQREKSTLKRNALAIQQDLAESEARREIQVLAPTTGTVTAIAAEVGKPVSAESSLTSLLPTGSELEAEIYAPSRSVGFIKPGMKALLRYRAYPYQKFGQYEAVVHEIAGTSMSVQDLTLPGVVTSLNQSSEPLYRIRLKLKKQSVFVYGKPISLKSGMLLDASIVLENRRLYEWILEPLFSISGRG